MIRRHNASAPSRGTSSPAHDAHRDECSPVRLFCPSGVENMHCAIGAESEKGLFYRNDRRRRMWLMTTTMGGLDRGGGTGLFAPLALAREFVSATGASPVIFDDASGERVLR